MRLPASFGSKVEAADDEVMLVIPESFYQTLRLTQQRVRIVSILTWILTVVLLLSIYLKYSTGKIQIKKEEPLVIIAQFNLVFVLLLISIGMSGYASRLKEFLRVSSNFNLISMLKSYRAMWVKLGIGLLLLMILSGIIAVKTLL